ncbi:MAG TPA: hypothetical protein PK955_07460, partial [Methanoregulaceae archaeon]|nr:hypothetical protein [Methanoregulaceae archaeon]
MYHETYHPLAGDNLKNILDNAGENEKKIILETVDAATKGKIRKYRIDIAPPNPDGKGGIWYEVDNGIV